MGITKLINLLNRNRAYFAIAFFLCLTPAFKCQDIRGAYIQTKWVSGYTYSADLYLFTSLPSTVFRPYVRIGWGSAMDTLKFIESSCVNNIVKSKFTGSFVYGGPSAYNITLSETFRIANIKNISSSQNESIGLLNKLILNQFVPNNYSPMFQSDPVYFSKSGGLAKYDPKFIDPDGDSLSYSLINCFASNYYLPSTASVSPTGVLSFSKDSIGLYAFSYKIDEWKKDFDGNYTLAGSSQFDFILDINNSIGIDELVNQNQLNIYPNPVSNTLYISSGQYFEKETQIEIINALGQTVLKLNYSYEIDVSQLSPGYYIIKIISPDKRQFHSKFLKE